MNITGTGNGRVAGVFLKTVNVSLQLGAGDVFERCELKLNLGDSGEFDDGLQFSINGIRLLNFDQRHWMAMPDFQNGGKFDTDLNGSWSPWTAEGTPRLEIVDNSIQLMVMSTNGIREDALLSMDTAVVEWVLSTSFTYDCQAGFTLEFGNQNGGGGPGSINAFLQVEAYVDPCVDVSDVDADGLLDIVDACPIASGVAALNGCPWPVYIGNNYKSTVVSNSIEMSGKGYLCSLTASSYYNLGYHSGANPEPVVGDFIIYNTNYSFPQTYSYGGDEFAFMKLRDYNKIIEVRKADGEIISLYTCQ